MNKEKKQKGNVLGLLIPILLIIIIVLFLIFLIKYEPTNESNNDVLKNKNFCHSMYHKVFEEVEDKILDHDSTITALMSDFNFFYSKKEDSCILAYTRNTFYQEDTLSEFVNTNTYIIKDYLNDNNLFYCNTSDKDFNEETKEYESNNVDIQNCYDDYKSTIEKLRE